MNDFNATSFNFFQHFNQNSMSSVLDKEVSFYKSLNDVKGLPCNLQILLNMDVYQGKVELLRQSENDQVRAKLKRSLPCFTPSGTFSVRNSNGLLKHSGLIQFDIDLKENLHISNFENIKREIRNIENVAYVGHSVGGQGLWGLVPVMYPEKHTDHFKFLAKAFLNLGICLDLSGSDVTRLRILNYDPSAYFNHHAIPLTSYEESVAKVESGAFVKNFSASTNSALLKAALILIQRNRIDITKGYRNWYSLGCFFAGLPNGNIFFHAVSQFNPEYSVRDTDRQFQNCKKYASKYSIGTFISICKSSGIDFAGNQMVCTEADYEFIG